MVGERGELTIKPFRIIFECPLETKFLTTSSQIVQVRAKYNGIGFGELCISARVKGR